MDRFGTRAWLAVPMILDNQVVGVLEASETRYDRWFTTDEVSSAEIFAAQAMAALARVGAYERERRHMADLDLLLQATASMAQNIEMEPALHAICEADRRRPRLQDDRRVRVGPCARTAARPGVLPGAAASSTMRSSAPCTPRATTPMLPPSGPARRSPVTSRSDDRQSSRRSQELTEWDVGSCLYVPMVYQDRAVGLLEVDFVEEGYAFSDRELQLMQAIANQAAVTMVNAQLYDSQRRQTAQAWSMNEMVTAVGSTLDVSEVLRVASQNMRKVATFDRVGFWFLSETAGEADVAMLEGAEAALQPALQVRRDSRSPVWRAIDSKLTVLVDDMRGELPVTGMEDCAQRRRDTAALGGPRRRAPWRSAVASPAASTSRRCRARAVRGADRRGSAERPSVRAHPQPAPLEPAGAVDGPQRQGRVHARARSAGRRVRQPGVPPAGVLGGASRAGRAGRVPARHRPHRDLGPGTAEARRARGPRARAGARPRLGQRRDRQADLPRGGVPRGATPPRAPRRRRVSRWAQGRARSPNSRACWLSSTPTMP